MTNETMSPGKDWRTILSLVISALGTVYFFAQALIMGVLWLVMMISGTSPSETTTFSILGWGSLLSAILLLPITILEIYKLKQHPLPAWMNTQNPTLRKFVLFVILIWPLFILLGWFIAGHPTWATFILGPINLFVAGLPVLWILNAAQWNLKGGSQIRKWRIFGFSLTLSPVIIMVLELIVMLILLIVWIGWMAFRFSSNPTLEQDLMFIVNQITLAGDDLDLIIKLLKPYLLRPSVIFWALAIFSGMMPMIEEIFKPLAIWALAKQKITPQEGFVSGLLCGAGFALMENVLYFTGAVLAEDWLLMAIGRSGTGVMHMLTSGLVGWALAKTWRDGKWPLMVLATLGAFFLHGLWNALALVAGVAPIFIFGLETTFWQMLLFYLPLILLLLLSAGGMVAMNRYLRKQQEPQDSSESIRHEKETQIDDIALESDNNLES